MLGYTSTSDFGTTVPVVMALVFVFYGGLHPLAWFYQFKSEKESVLWKLSPVSTASFGLNMLLLFLMNKSDQNLQPDTQTSMSNGVLARFLGTLLLIYSDFAGRSYLVIESFIALPNSPPSVYDVPVWTAYFLTYDMATRSVHVCGIGPGPEAFSIPLSFPTPVS
jgi:hypothetical protein